MPSKTENLLEGLFDNSNKVVSPVQDSEKHLKDMLDLMKRGQRSMTGTGTGTGQSRSRLVDIASDIALIAIAKHQRKGQGIVRTGENQQRSIMDLEGEGVSLKRTASIFKSQRRKQKSQTEMLKLTFKRTWMASDYKKWDGSNPEWKPYETFSQQPLASKRHEIIVSKKRNEMIVRGRRKKAIEGEIVEDEPIEGEFRVLKDGYVKGAKSKKNKRSFVESAMRFASGKGGALAAGWEAGNLTSKFIGMQGTSSVGNPLEHRNAALTTGMNKYHSAFWIGISALVHPIDFYNMASTGNGPK